MSSSRIFSLKSDALQGNKVQPWITGLHVFDFGKFGGAAHSYRSSQPWLSLPTLMSVKFVFSTSGNLATVGV